MKRTLINLLSAISIIVLAIPGASQAMPFTNMVVLGDSLSDVGNLFIATANNNMSPIPQLPQDPPYFEGRFSDGPVYVEHVWRELGLPGDIKPSLDGGTNYAVGGARSRYHALDRSINPTFNPVSDASLFHQFTLLGQRDALISHTGGTLDPEALYTVWIGSNDVADALQPLLLGDALQANLMLSQSANDLATVINDLVGAGAQRLLIPTVPNLGLTPNARAIPGAEPFAAVLSQTYNDLVDDLLADSNAEIIRFDTFQLLNDLVNDPTSFGLSGNMNVTDTCFDGYVGVPGTSICSNPEQYLFWDRIHPSAVTHQVLAMQTIAAIPEPGSILLIGLGIIALGIRRRVTP